jgi:hypothetical protein
MSDLSWLNPTPHAIAVYASQPLSPVATQHSLPRGRYSLLGPEALVALRYVDEADLSNVTKWLVRGSIPIAAILVPAAFFLSVLLPDARTPNRLIYLAYVGAGLLAVGVLVLGVGLVRRRT